MAKFYSCHITFYAADVLPETFKVKNKVKKGKMFFLNQVAETVRSFIGEIGPNPDRTWTFEYSGDLKTDFMEGLNKSYQKNSAVPLGGI
jgi:hypothetical protein